MYLSCPRHGKECEIEAELVGRWEYDTNVGPTLEISPIDCTTDDWTDDEEQEVYEKLMDADHEPIIPDYD